MQHSARKHHIVVAVLAVALGLAGFSLAGRVAAAPPRQSANGSVTVNGRNNYGAGLAGDDHRGEQQAPGPRGAWQLHVNAVDPQLVNPTVNLNIGR